MLLIAALFGLRQLVGLRTLPRVFTHFSARH
jgi:hypothetical protein